MSSVSDIAELYNRLGAAQAAHAAGPGQVWGNVAIGLGDLAGKSYQQGQDEKRLAAEQQVRDQQLAESRQRMGLEAAAGTREATAFNQQQAAQGRALRDATHAKMVQTMGAVRSAPDTVKPQVWAQARAAIIGQGWAKPQDVPAQYPGDDAVDAELRGLMSAKEQWDVAHPKLEPVSEYGLANPNTGEVVVPATPKAPPTPTAGMLDAAWQALDAKRRLGQKLTPEEQADYDAYNARKNDPAAERQATTISAQVAQQKRAQDFAELQAGRADLDKNVTTPFLTAQASANTLRDVVTAAKNGNKVAGSLQSLEATMAAIRAQGLNRINTAEIGSTANAGSLWDGLVGWVGKADKGQPVPADIQKDMTDFADILEKAAYKKYTAGHASTKALYPALAAVQPLPDPFPTQPAPAAPSGRVNPFRKP